MLKPNLQLLQSNAERLRHGILKNYGNLLPPFPYYRSNYVAVTNPDVPRSTKQVFLSDLFIGFTI